MLIVDDLLVSPYRGIKWIFKEVHCLAQEELAREPARIKKELAELYRRLETGELSEEAFDKHERQLLDRLDKLEREAKHG